MQSESVYISKWSGKPKSARKQSTQKGTGYQKLPPGMQSEAGETASPKIAALGSEKLTEKATAKHGPQPRKTPSVDGKPKTAPAARPSEQSCIGTASSDGATSIKSAGSHISGRPSTASVSAPDLRSQAAETDVSETGSIKPFIRNMTGLLEAVRAAKASEIASVMQHLAFKPREGAFTFMFRECGSDVAKALEVWQAMKRRPGVYPNNISYSVIIRICGEGGYWDQAELLFKEQLKAADTDINCQPNAISYSKLILAMLRSKQIEKALHWYCNMKASGILADPRLYNDVIMSAFRAGVALEDILIIFDHMHYDQIFASAEAYILVLERLDSERNWQKAEELFICSVVAGAVVLPSVCLTLMKIYTKAGATQQAAQLLQEFLAQDYTSEDKEEMAHAALEAYAKAGRHQRAIELWQSFWKNIGTTNGPAASLVLEAIKKGGEAATPKAALRNELLRAIKAHTKRENSVFGRK